MSQPARKPSRDQRRDAILAVAGEVFQEGGYAEASMSCIAARVGGSKGTLYNYFKSKDELFEAYIEERCSRFAEAAFGPLEDVDGPLGETLSTLGERLMAHVCSEASARTLQLIMAEARRSPRLAQMFYDAGPGVGVEQLTRYLERAQRRGEFHAPDCSAAARTFTTLCRGEHHFRRLLALEPPPSPAVVKAEIKQVVDLFLAAYGAAKRANSA